MEHKTIFGITATLNRSMTLTAVLVLVLFLAGCGGNRLTNKKTDIKAVIWQQQDQFVRIEAQDHDSILMPDNDHPVKLSANLIRKLLGSLEVQFEGKKKPIPVFSQDELEVLGESASLGLAQAGPQEDITFAIAGIHEGHTAPVISTYRLFVKKDLLNLIIGTLHGEYAENIDRVKHPLVPASRKYIPLHQRQTTTSWTIVPHLGMKHKTTGAITSDVSTRPDWLVLNPTPETYREAAQIWEDSAQIDAEQHKINMKIESMQRSIEQMKQTITTGAPMAAPGGSIGLDKIKQRLQVLQELRNSGFISDDEFRSKKQQILDSI